MSFINFYKKQTVLNDILTNKSFSIIDNSQLNFSINTAKSNKEKYIISDNKNIDNFSELSDVVNLYSALYNIRPQIKNNEIVNNIRRYNNCNYTETSVFVNEQTLSLNIKQETSYINLGKGLNSNLLIYNSSYNLLYYLQHNKLNLMSYVLELKNGFNYNNINHMLYFNIDNNYIRSINNTLYYNYNHIRKATPTQSGVVALDKAFLTTRNSNYKKSNEMLTVNKSFKYDVFATLNKIKNLYNNCKNIYATLSYYDAIDDFNENYLKFENTINNVSYKTSIEFVDSKLFYTNYKLNTLAMDIENADTIYVNDLSSVNFRIGYAKVEDCAYLENINSYNSNILKNRISLMSINTDMSVNISYNHYYKYIKTTINSYQLSEQWMAKNNAVGITGPVEKGSMVNELIPIKISKENINKHIIGTTYHLSLSIIDQGIFNNSGIHVIYNGTPCLAYINTNQANKYEQRIIIPRERTLNIRKLDCKTSGLSDVSLYTDFTFLSAIQASDISKVYFFLTDYPLYTNTMNGIISSDESLNETIFKYLKDNNIITQCHNLKYYRAWVDNRREYFPMLNTYPKKYINEKFFTSKIYLDTPISEELDTCLTEIKNTSKSILEIYAIIANNDHTCGTIKNLRFTSLNLNG